MDTPFIVIDDILPAEIADNIELKLKRELPWRYINDITYNSDRRNTPAFAHVFKNNEWGGFESAYIDIVMPIIEYGTAAVNYKWNQLVKARTFMQLPLHENFTKVGLDALHTDQPFPHLVLLYYVFDADGDTVIVDKMRSEGGMITDDLSPDAHPIITRITPKKNRLVIFDGRYYHTAYQPRHGLRCVVNFNLLGEFL